MPVHIEEKTYLHQARKALCYYLRSMKKLKHLDEK